MAFWISLKEQSLALWNRWTIGQRTGFIAAALACIAAVSATLIWASQPEYIVIASQLTATRSIEIAGILDTEKIDYQLNFSSSAVSVARGDVSRARQVLAGQLNPEEETEISATPSLFESPRTEEDRRRQGLERKIATSIKRIKGVREATVTISRPDETPFSIEKSPVTAAVVVEPMRGDSIPGATAEAILQNVAKSVPGLKPENITLSDTNGRQFNATRGVNSDLDMQLVFRQKYEASLAQKATEILHKIEGLRADVQVTAEIDFDSMTQKKNIFDPESNVKATEKILDSKNDTAPPPPTGVAGTPSNIPNDPNARTNNNGGYENSQVDTTYLNSSTEETLIKTAGAITRLSVAVIADLSGIKPPAGGAADPNATPALDQQQIEKLVRNAVGIQDDRQDVIEVVLAPLAPEEVEVPAVPGFNWQQWQPLIQSVSLGLAATLAFLIGMMLMKRMKPIVITETVGPGIPLADARRLAAISEQAKAHPEIVANVLSAWLNEEQPTIPMTPPPGNGAEPSVTTPPGNASVPRSRNTGGGSGNEGRKAA
jgi:flagellar M-ring protein FliF